MRFRIILAAMALGLPLAAVAGDVPTKDEFADLSRLIHRMVLKKVPREHEQRFNWGNTIPLPDKLPLPNLRTYLKVGDRIELPHGAWKRIRVKLDDPNKDLKIKVKEFKKIDKASYRVVLDAVVTLRCDGEWNQWQKGLLLLRVDGQADATVASTIVSNVELAVNVRKFPPEVKADPKIVDLTLDLQDFTLNQLGGTLQGEKIRQIANDLMRDTLHDLLKAAEPMVRDYANQVLAQSLQESKGKLSVGELLKKLPKEPNGKDKEK
jgi:hypothetical protein